MDEFVSLSHTLLMLDNNRSLKTRERSGRKEEKNTTSWIRIPSLIHWEGVDTGHRGTGTLCSVCVCPCVSVCTPLSSTKTL